MGVPQNEVIINEGNEGAPRGSSGREPYGGIGEPKHGAARAMLRASTNEVLVAPLLVAKAGLVVTGEIDQQSQKNAARTLLELRGNARPVLRRNLLEIGFADE